VVRRSPPAAMPDGNRNPSRRRSILALIGGAVRSPRDHHDEVGRHEMDAVAAGTAMPGAIYLAAKEECLPGRLSAARLEMDAVATGSADPGAFDMVTDDMDSRDAMARLEMDAVAAGLVHTPGTIAKAASASQTKSKSNRFSIFSGSGSLPPSGSSPKRRDSVDRLEMDAVAMGKARPGALTGQAYQLHKGTIGRIEMDAVAAGVAQPGALENAPPGNGSLVPSGEKKKRFSVQLPRRKSVDRIEMDLAAQQHVAGESPRGDRIV